MGKNNCHNEPKVSECSDYYCNLTTLFWRWGDFCFGCKFVVMCVFRMVIVSPCVLLTKSLITTYLEYPEAEKWSIPKLSEMQLGIFSFEAQDS